MLIDLADRVVELRDGRIVGVGPARPAEPTSGTPAGAHVAPSAPCARSSAAARTRRTSAKSSTSPAGTGGSSSTSGPVTAARRSPWRPRTRTPSSWPSTPTPGRWPRPPVAPRLAPSRGGLPNVVFVATASSGCRPASMASPTASRSSFRGARCSAARSASTRRSRRPSRARRAGGRLEIVLSIVERTAPPSARGAFGPQDVERMAARLREPRPRPDRGLPPHARRGPGDRLDVGAPSPDGATGRSGRSACTGRRRSPEPPRRPPTSTPVGYPRIERMQGG